MHYQIVFSLDSRVNCRDSGMNESENFDPYALVRLRMDMLANQGFLNGL